MDDDWRKFSVSCIITFILDKCIFVLAVSQNVWKNKDS